MKTQNDTIGVNEKTNTAVEDTDEDFSTPNQSQDDFPFDVTREEENSQESNQNTPCSREIPQRKAKDKAKQVIAETCKVLQEESSEDENNYAFLTQKGDPDTLTVQEARSSENWPEWENAIRSEIRSLEENNTWEFADLPKGRKVIGCRFTLKQKRDADGKISKYKARLVEQDFARRKVRTTPTHSLLSPKSILF